MNNSLPFSQLISNEIYGSPVGTLGAFITICVGLFTLIKALTHQKNNPPNDIFKENGISSFAMFLFAIRISLNKTPTITKFDLLLSILIGIILLIAGAFLSGFFVKVMNAPVHSAALTYKPTGEIFYLSLDTATEAVLIGKKDAWSITPKQCKSPQELPATPSVGLVRFLCEAFESEEYREEIRKFITNFQKTKPCFYALISVVETFLMWMLISISLTLIYKNKIRKYVIQQHEIALSYVM